MNLSHHYNRILLEADLNSNLVVLDAKIDAILGKPSLLLQLYKSAIAAIAAVTGALTIGSGAYLGYTLGGDFKTTTFGAGLGALAFLQPALITIAKYKIVDHIAHRASLNLVNNNKIPKEEKLEIINELIKETKSIIPKLTDDKDKQHCINALDRLQSALSIILRQKV